ncbi:MAG: hypothetical protein IPH75_14735 [bacterium]|nr:hypothetical protein [bacterium]
MIVFKRGNYIGYNKFVVYVDKDEVPQSVMTGSTNWSPTGLCSQTNNIIVLENRQIAERYYDYWHRLLTDDANQSAELRKVNATNSKPISLGRDQGNLKVWFAPNTKRKTKPAENPTTPPDLSEVFELIDSAKSGILFLLFSAGAPSILHHLKALSERRLKANKPLFVRGAVSDTRTAREFATRVYNDSVLTAPNRLITGVGGIRDPFSIWERELERLGHAVIHDKVLVIDPFGRDCAVVTGSHNLGFKASYSNDENLCIIKGNRPIATAFAAHVLDVVNHYNWRYKLLNSASSDRRNQSAFVKLDQTDSWQDKYFPGNFLQSRDLFFFPQVRKKKTR